MIEPDLLEPVLGTDAVLEQLKHKPGRRTTYRARGRAGSAIVKVYASERAPTVAARIDALAAGPEEPVVPRVLLCAPEHHLLVLSEVPGIPLRLAFLDADERTCARAGAALGAWHTAWAGTAPTALVPHSLGRELEILSSWAERAPAAIGHAVRARLPAFADGAWPAATVIHRDLYEEQVLVGDLIGLIDLDDAALGPAELDLGNLLGHLELLGRRTGRDLADATEALLGAYRRSGQAPDKSLLERCRNLTLLRLACIHSEPTLLDLVPSATAA